MKKIILLALIIVMMMVGCDFKNPDGSYNTSKSTHLNTVVIDSCEYIMGYCLLAHKGNCKFCKEHRTQKLKELVEQLKK